MSLPQLELWKVAGGKIYIVLTHNGVELGRSYMSVEDIPALLSGNTKLFLTVEVKTELLHLLP